ncbi:hypothetical protein GCM10010276_65340 [Streptomyces longisporus]|uniref:Uncharacterized protein n=1 Tax=Streptomyces longisporus TaxID=1948 RepID=A0ABP6A716_STRLO
MGPARNRPQGRLLPSSSVATTSAVALAAGMSTGKLDQRLFDITALNKSATRKSQARA